MKKYKLIPACLLVCAFANIGCDDESNDTASGPLPNGGVCNAMADCLSGYCSEQHFCADNPASLKDNGAECSKSSECKSDFCDSENKCAEKAGKDKLENGMTCDRNQDCISDYCYDSKCAEKASEEQSGKIGSSCKEDSECESGLFCHEYKCDSPLNLNGKVCSGGSEPQCIAGVLVSCRQWAGMDYYYDVETCKEGTVCISIDGNAACAESCNESDLDKEYTTCDPENTDEEGWPIGVLVHKCINVNDAYRYAVVRWENCGFGQWCGPSDACE